MNPITYRVAMEIVAHEAIVRQAYKDSVGKWTWSVGLTSATGHDVERYIGKPATMQKCLEVFVWALDNYADAVRKEFAGYPLTEAQFAGALSFHWNTGAIKSATWVDHWKAGNVVAAERSFKSWNKAGGKVSQGLVTRRAAEADLLFRGKWSNITTATEYTRLTSRSTPDWGSAVKVDISVPLKAAIGVHSGEDRDVPVEVPETFDITRPDGITADLWAEFLKALEQFITSFFKGKL